MFNTNEFTVLVNPKRPNVIRLRPTRRTKRNLRIRKMKRLAVLGAGVYAVALLAEEAKRRNELATPSEETPTEN